MPKTKPRAVPRRPRVEVDAAAAAALEERIARSERGTDVSAQGESEKGQPQAARREGTPRRSNAQTSKRSRTQRPPKPKGPGITWRDGRVLADGSRRGAGWVRRMTVYLPPELAHDLDVAAAERGEDKSAIVADALARTLGTGSRGG